MKPEYDIVIIGGGPSGLSLAQCCSRITKSILIVEREDDIGGCHRVRRVEVNGERVFTEHGPRVYSDTYVNVIQLLQDMGLDFYDLFTPYKFSLADIGGSNVLYQLTFCEKLLFVKEFMLLMMNGDHGKNITMKQYTTFYSFQKKSVDVIDRVCRLTDGATIEKYTLYQFLELANTQFFYKLYQPKSPNDTGLFRLWKQYLVSKGVEIQTQTSVKNLYESRGIVDTIELETKDGVYSVKAKKVILAVPPKNLYQILNLSSSPSIRSSFGENLLRYMEETSYIDYICMTFHWDKPLNLPKVYGFPKSYWGVGFVVLSDYMKFEENVSKTVLSIIITIPDSISPRINKTANQCDPGELFIEVMEQLKESFPMLESPTLQILSPSMLYDKTKNKWINLDTAFISTANFPYLQFQSSIPNLYTVGTHTGRQKYHFTSMESAVSNGIALSHYLYPKLKKKYSIRKSISIRDVVAKIFIIFFLLVIVKIIYTICKKDVGGKTTIARNIGTIKRYR